jgi:hypothetical protein
VNTYLADIKLNIYDKCGLEVSYFEPEKESKEYDACQFKLNDFQIISRTSKITPKKLGQFVTFWKRNINGVIAPFHESDDIDFYIINIATENRLGHFVFPKHVLIEKGIISTNKKEGKRGFRVYPIWDTVLSKQAKQTQKWQLNYFIEIKDSCKPDKVLDLYQNK